MKYLLHTVLAAVAVSGCASDPTYSSFNSEAGATIDSGYFGNATMNNINVQSSDQRDYTIDLARRFAAEVDSTVNFAFDSAVLDGAAQATLLRQADWIRQFPEVRFRVYGHTDLVGSDAYNQALGLRRAQAVVAFLIAQGIDRSRLEAVASFGETRPVVPTPDREVRNRRTVTEVAGTVSGDPMLLHGKYAQVIFRQYVASAVSAPTLGGATLSQ